MPDQPTPVVPPVVPHLVIGGAAEAIEFYKKAFGATEMMRMPGPDGRLMYVQLEINGGYVYLADDFPEFHGGQGSSPLALGGTPVTVHLNLPDVYAAWDKAVAAGAEVILPLAEQPWGDIYGQVKDPFGHIWALDQAHTPLSPEEMKQRMDASMAGQQG